MIKYYLSNLDIITSEWSKLLEELELNKILSTEASFLKELTNNESKLSFEIYQYLVCI